MITVETMMSYRPCRKYPHERVLELWAWRSALTAQQIADLDIPAQDRIWALCAWLARLDRASMSAFARGRADRAKQHADKARHAAADAAAYAAADAAAYAAYAAAYAAYADAYAAAAYAAYAADAAAAAYAADAAAAAYAAYAAAAESRREAIADLVARIEAIS